MSDQLKLFPLRMVTVIPSSRDEKCPTCGESRLTDDIYGILTFLCGASVNREKVDTPCEGTRWLGFMKKLEFTVTEYVGCEVTKLDKPGELIREKEGLKPGDKIVVDWNPPLRFEGTVIVDKEDTYIDCGATRGILAFDKDERHCWVCTGLYNLAAIERLDIRKD